MKFLIPIIIGAIIGYVTNWLAIKMLFRPHYEKKILGVKIPFTPGLIPKEMDRIAKSIGDAVASHLITPEAITKSVEGEIIDENLEIAVRSSINKLKSSDYTIKSFISAFGEDTYYKAIKFIEKKLINDIYNKIIDQRFKDELKEGLRQIINQEAMNIFNDNRALDEAIPKYITNKLKGYVYLNKNRITKSIRELILKPSIKIRIKSRIEEVAENNLPKLVTTFVSPEIISNKVFNAIEEQFDNENTSEDIAFAINKIIDKTLESRVSDLAMNISRNISSEEISNICQSIIDHIYGKENDSKYILSIEEKIGLAVYNLVEDFCNKPIKDIMKDINDDTIDNIVRFIKMLLQRVAIQKLPSIVDSLNIAKIVENQINSFEVSYAEDIIMEIASKELKAITWLGALFGGMIGIVTPLLQ